MTTVTFEDARERMIAVQIRKRGITDQCVIDAIRAVPRHVFVSQALRHKAYDDCPLGIGCGQTISQPYMVALMTELLRLSPEDRVLEIGTGSAYQTAILAEIAATVVSVERQRPLVRRARKLLFDLGVTNVAVSAGDGSLGYAKYGPYDAILVTAGSPRVPPALRNQLALGGRLVCPVGSRRRQDIVRIVRSARGFHEEKGIGCIFVPLIGTEGWKE